MKKTRVAYPIMTQWYAFSPSIERLPAHEQGRIKLAFELGARVHADQRRKSGEPYFTHPIAVAKMLSALGADADTIIAALLHDTVEDTSLTLEEIHETFNSDVVMLIDGVTKLENIAFSDRPTLNEKTETIRKIFTMMQRDIRIMLIKLVDRLHNMQTIGSLTPERQRSFAQETLDLYVRIADRLCMQDLRDELEGLCRAILDPPLYSALLSLRSENERQGDAILYHMLSVIDAYFPSRTVGLETHREPKSWSKLMLQKETTGTASGVSSCGIVLLCVTVEDCYRMLGMLHQIWRREAGSFQDYINSPTINGYRGLHTTIILKDGTRVRAKIRTEQMHDYARRGVAAVCFANPSHDLQSLLPWTQHIAPLSNDTVDHSETFWQSLQTDILGISITIHGTGDEVREIPEGATALDGLFYLYGDAALHAKAVRVNGKEVAFGTTLRHTDTVENVLCETISVDVFWLKVVKTSIASAIIRAALTQKSDEERTAVGRKMLEDALLQNHIGYIEEFDVSALDRSAPPLGYTTFSRLLLAIADGRISVQNVIDTLFARQIDTNKIVRCTIDYTMDTSNDVRAHNVEAVLHMYRWAIIRSELLSHTNHDMATGTLRVKLPPAQLASLQEALSLAGASDVHIRQNSRTEILLLITVVVLWTFNPVMARFFLDKQLPALSLMTIRFFSLGFYNWLMYLTWRFMTRQKVLPVRRSMRMGLFPSIANAGISLYYFALSSVPPSVHLTILRFNTIFLPTLVGVRRSAFSRRLILLLLCLLALSLAIIHFTVRASPFALLLSVTTMLFYALYSLSMERVLQKHHIGFRLPFLLRDMGTISFVFGFMLLPWQPMKYLLDSRALLAAIYVVICVGISHNAYSALLKTARFKYFSDILLVEIPLAMVLEYFLLGIRLPMLAYSAITLILAVLFVLRLRTVQAKMG